MDCLLENIRMSPKQRHYFSDKGPSSQSYSFSSSHVWMCTKELMLLDCGVREDS